jgi:pimeloyl-ACP methyl ester carboxylesterase
VALDVTASARIAFDHAHGWSVLFTLSIKEILMRFAYQLCFAVAIISAVATASVTAQTATGSSSQFFTASDGVRIHYLTLGETGSWVVLIHGFADTADRMWFRSGIASALARTHRVVALDNRNHGKSGTPQPDGPGRPQDVIELMDHLKIERAHVHGYSMGGGFAAWMLATHPQRMLSAGLGGSGIFETDEKLAAQAGALDKPVPAMTSDLGGQPASSTNSSPFPPGGSALTPAQLARLKTLIDVSAARMRALPPLQIDLVNVRIPVLAITGEFDRPAWRTQRLWRELRDFRSVVLAGKNHLTAAGFLGPMPAEYIDAVVNFINANDR